MFKGLDSEVAKPCPFAQGLNLLLAFDEPNLEQLRSEVDEGCLWKSSFGRFIMLHRNAAHQTDPAFGKPSLFDVFDCCLGRIWPSLAHISDTRHLARCREVVVHLHEERGFCLARKNKEGLPGCRVVG